MSDVFLSYSHRSLKYAKLLARELTALHTSVWLASQKIQLGDLIEEQISKAIRDARLIAFLIDPHTSPGTSAWVEHEYMMALEQAWSDEGKILVPVLIGNAEAPPFLRHTVGLRVTSQKSAWTRVAKSIAKLLNEGNVAKRRKAPLKEQTQRLNLIERGANALRVAELENVRKP